MSLSRAIYNVVRLCFQQDKEKEEGEEDDDEDDGELSDVSSFPILLSIPLSLELTRIISPG